MKRAESQLLVGVGSPFGDDRLGWLVTEELERRGVDNVQLRRALTPVDLLDWLASVDRLVICDACYGPTPAAQYLRFDWPDETIENVEFAGTHDMNLAATLRLAEQLRLLPKRTTIWSMAVEYRQKPPVGAVEDPLSPELQGVFESFVAAIERDLQHA